MDGDRGSGCCKGRARQSVHPCWKKPAKLWASLAPQSQRCRCPHERGSNRVRQLAHLCTYLGGSAANGQGRSLTGRPALPPGETGPRCSLVGQLHLETCKPPLGPVGSKGKSGSELRAGWDCKRHRNAAKVCSTPPQLRLYAPQTPGTHQTIRSAAPAEALPYTKSPPGRQGGSPPGVAGATVGRGAPSAAPRGAAAGRPASH